MEVVNKEDINEDTLKEVTDSGLSSPTSGVSSDTAIPKLASVQGRTTGPTRRSTKGGWTEQEDDMLKKAVKFYNGKNWKKIAECFHGRTDVQCLHRWQKVLNPDLVKGPWTKEEDDCIIELVNKYGCKKWSVIAQSLPGRIGKQCRERWHNHLNPAIKKHAWTKEEEFALIRAHEVFGNKWAEIAKFLPGRADNSIKNHWNCSVKKKLDSYMSSEFAGDLPGIAKCGLYNHDCKEELLKSKVSNVDSGLVHFLEQKKDSDDGIDTSLGMSFLGVHNARPKNLISHPNLVEVESRRSKGIRCQKESLTDTQFQPKSPVSRGLICELCEEDANYGSISDDLHRSVSETEVSCEISSDESMMTMHPLESTVEPVNLSDNSPRPSGELSLSLSTLTDPLDVTYDRRKCLSPHIAVPVSTKGIPESPKRQRSYPSHLQESGGVTSKLNYECNMLFSNISSGVFGSEIGQAGRKSKVAATNLQSEDVSFAPLFYQPLKQTSPDIMSKNERFTSAEKNSQLANSPACCSTPPSHLGRISIDCNSPEIILRTAAKNFKNTPSIIRKRTRETSKQDCSANDSNGVFMSEVRSRSSNDSQSSTHSCDHILAGQDDLTSKHLQNVKWLSLSSPSLHSEAYVSLRSVEKRLEYAFDLEWDNSKAKCSVLATESESIDGNTGLLHNSPDSSRLRSDQNFTQLGFGVNCNSVI